MERWWLVVDRGFRPDFAHEFHARVGAIDLRKINAAALYPGSGLAASERNDGASKTLDDPDEIRRTTGTALTDSIDNLDQCPARECFIR